MNTGKPSLVAPAAPAPARQRLYPGRWLIAVAAAVVMALATGIPTDLVPTSLFTRMTPPVWWDYPVWILSAVLVGALTLTYFRPTACQTRPRADSGRALGASVLTLLAVGCPVCNKLVVLALGTSGALNYFGPIQPALGIASVAILALTLLLRLRAQRRATFSLERATP